MTTAQGRLIGCEPSGYQAQVRASSSAVVDAASGVRLSYAELDRRVGACAGWLKTSLGEPEGERVAILARNSIDQIVLFLACQRAGAVFTPLNWRLTPVELEALLADCAPRLLVCDAEFRATAGASSPACPLVALADLPRLTEGCAPFAARPSPDRACVILYTSGTTGRPKGVVITCANAFHACLNMALVGEVGPQSVLLSDAPMFHTVGLFAVARTTLTVGGTLVVSDRFTPQTTLDRLSDPALGITHYFGVPQIASALRDAPGYAQADLSRLKAIFVGGAPLPAPLVHAFLADGITLVNGYGMSECGATVHMPLAPEPTREHPGCIGVPAPMMGLRIADDAGCDVAPGEAGEVWVGGPAVSPGYWRQPQATAEAFRDGWFRTGDVARVEPFGLYRLLDRKKDMYISGGENVYPAEVEAVLLAHPDVVDAAVVGASDPRWGECGVAFIVARPGAGLADAEVLAHCEPRLARYKHPRRIHFTDAIARTASGKIQKTALRQLADAHARSEPLPSRG